MLIPLAATSYNAAIRWLGGQRWRRLHKLIYPVALLVPIHYLMLVKSWPAQPIIYAAISASLLLYRLVPSRKAATRK
jgi:sulfoxide reductase heme-binding subunit YedZ